MGERTGIEWTDRTHNPWIGCTRISEGCKHCYAETLAKRHKWAEWGPGKPRHRTSEATRRQPLAWDRKARKAGRFDFVFCASLADVLDPEVPDAWRQELALLIQRTPNLTWLLLTKRPEKWAKHWPQHIAQAPLNAWWGTSVENQDAWDARRNHLKAIPAVRRFLSLEPLLGPVEFGENGLAGIDWAIVGGETGPGARPINVQWVRRIHKQCGDAGVSFFMKKWGNVEPQGQRNGFLDGYEIRERPPA